MNLTEKLKIYFSKKQALVSPLLIIKKDTDANGIEYQSIEDAIADLENELNIPPDKTEKLKSSLRNLKNKTSITIRNGEIISLE